MFTMNHHRPRKSKYDHITKERLQELRDAGLTVDQMAEELAIPRGTVCTLLRKHGVAGHVRGPKRRNAE